MAGSEPREQREAMGTSHAAAILCDAQPHILLHDPDDPVRGGGRRNGYPRNPETTVQRPARTHLAEGLARGLGALASTARMSGC